MKTLFLCAVSLVAAAPAFAEFQPSLLGHMSELRADILRVADPKGPKAAPPASKPNPDAQARIWAAEEALVAVRLEMENQFLAFTKAVDAEQTFFAAVPQQTRDAYKALVAKGAAAQQKVVDLGVLQPAAAGNSTRYVFGLRGQAPSAEAKKAFEDYIEAMAAFDDSPDADYMLAVLMKRMKTQPETVPAALKATMDNYFGFVQKMPMYTIRAMMVLGESIQANGGQFNSRWGLDDNGEAPKGRKS